MKKLHITKNGEEIGVTAMKLEYDFRRNGQQFIGYDENGATYAVYMVNGAFGRRAYYYEEAAV